MSKYYISQTHSNGFTYITEHGSDAPTGPVGPMTPFAWVFGWLMLLVGLAVIVLFVVAANTPNPGDANYVPPGSTSTQTQEG